MSMITSSAWVPRGFAAPFPKKYEFDEDEFERIAELAKLKLEDAQEDLEEAKAELDDTVDDPEETKTEEAGPSHGENGNKEKKKKKKSKKRSEDIDLDDDGLREYDLDNYDDDDEQDPDVAQTMGMFGNVKSLAYYESNKEDPYITLPDEEDDEDSDREALQILATDNMLLAAKVEDELAHLEVYVYEDAADNLYIHHDILLPAIPLCLEWLDIAVGKSDLPKDSTANFVAVGTMDPDIEIWDLDTVDTMYPNAILGQGGQAGDGKPKKKKKKKSKKANDEYHVDAVLSLAGNRKHRNLLASASADKTVKLWDLHTTQCAKSYSYHTDKVCSVAWHAVESTVLLSGSYDRTTVVADMRAPDAKAPRWGVESDVETARWDPHDDNYFFVTTEKGTVHYQDIRNAPATPGATKAVWTLQAHDASVSAFDVNPVIPGFLATGSTDKTVKLWNVQASGPALVVARAGLELGKIFSTSFAPDAEVAFRLAVAGSKGEVKVWDTSTNAAVRAAFATKLPSRSTGEVEERLVGIDDDESSSDDEDEGEEGGGADLGDADGDESMGDD